MSKWLHSNPLDCAKARGNGEIRAGKSVGQGLSRVAMGHGHVVFRLGQPLANFLSDHHRAMAPAGASEANGEITLAFADVVRQQVDKQLGDAFNELTGLRERADIVCDFGMESGKGTQLRNEMR